MRKILLAFCTALLLTGCATNSSQPGTGVVAPQTVEQGIAYAYPAHATATRTVTELLKLKKISVESAENALKISVQVKASLDLAQQLSVLGKPKDAQATLKLAQDALKGLEAFVEISKQ